MTVDHEALRLKAEGGNLIWNDGLIVHAWEGPQSLERNRNESHREHTLHRVEVVCTGRDSHGLQQLVILHAVANWCTEDVRQFWHGTEESWQKVSRSDVLLEHHLGRALRRTKNHALTPRQHELAALASKGHLLQHGTQHFDGYDFTCPRTDCRYRRSTSLQGLQRRVERAWLEGEALLDVSTACFD